MSQRSRNDLQTKIEKSIVHHSAAAIALIYFLVASVWILFSDKWALRLSTSFSELSFLQSMKGIGFVIFMALLIFFLVKQVHRLQSRVMNGQWLTDKLYRRIFMESPDAQIIYNIDSLHIEDANTQACQLFEQSVGELRDSDLAQLFASAKNAEQILRWLNIASVSGTQPEQMVECENATRDTPRLSLLQSTIVRDNAVLGCLVVHNIADNRRYIRNAEHAAQRLDVAREVSGLGCWEIDLKKQYVYCCNNVTRLFSLNVPANQPVPLSDFEKMSATSVFSDVVRQLSEAEHQQETLRQCEVEDELNQTHHVLLHAQSLRQDSRHAIIGTVIDKTEEKKTENMLRQQQAQWVNLVEALPLGVAILQNDKIAYANKATLAMFGAESLSAMTSRPLFDFVHPMDVERVKQRMTNLHDHKMEREDFLHRHLFRMNADPFEAEIAARLVTYEGQPAIQMVMRDLTEMIKTREELESANRRLSRLSSQTLDMLEQERKRIAGELHDDVGQSLTAIKLGIRWLTRRLKEPLLLNKAEDLQQICGDTLETVRNLSLMLRPAQLDSLGLPAAIRWQMDKLLNDTVLQLQMDDSRFEEISDKDTEIIAFRVLQESLTNIARHADARTVSVELVTFEESFEFKVTDDGKGFDVSRQHNSTGLINMKERVELASGLILIQSVPGVGTLIDVSLPIRAAKDETET